MIHKVKALYDEGRGSSQREIAARLKISRNTVRKYIGMSAQEVAAYREGQPRRRRLDLHRAYIIHLLETYPRLSAVKVLRKLREAHGEVSVSARSMRRYIEGLRGEVVLAQPRYYEPVLDMVPGEQCQVDGGELRGVRIGGVESTVHLMVFVLSYSRLMYVAASTRPIDTAELIRVHDAAFRYFGGCPRECVYDQTKLVVIEEQFRELTLNARFARYAATVGFRIHACEGYDPESKGKVEAGVKYVKRDGLYGETFADVAELHAHLRRWLDEVANVRVHGITGERPRERYAQAEQAAMRAYLVPTGLEELSGEAALTRLADKTGLIAYKANKYSVPLAYQRARVGVCEADGTLLITDLSSGACIARHVLSSAKGEVIKNTNHYRDREQQIADLEAELAEVLGSSPAARLCAQLRAAAPRNYKDQLRGARRLLGAHDDIAGDVVAHLAARARVSAVQLRDHLEAFAARPERLASPPPEPETGTGALGRYAGIGADNRGGRHDLH
jgi:transposase